MSNDFDFIDTAAAAELLGVSESTIRTYRRQGRLPFSKDEAGRVSFRKSNVVALRKPHASAPTKRLSRDARELPPFVLREPSRRADFAA